MAVDWSSRTKGGQFAKALANPALEKHQPSVEVARLLLGVLPDAFDAHLQVLKRPEQLLDQFLSIVPLLEHLTHLRPLH